MNSTLPPPHDPPLVSIIIPAYNSAAFITRAIQSALDQDYPNKEIVVVNDGSTDNTQQVLDAFGSKIRVFNQSNAGAAAARNTGIEQSQGDFIAFLDSDDEWLPGRLSKCVQPMLDFPDVGLTFCHSIRRFPDGHEDIRGQAFDRIRIYPRLIWPSYYQCTPASTVRRSVLDKTGLFNPALPSREDQDLWIRIEEHARVLEVPEPLVVVHVRATSLSKTLGTDEVEEAYFSILEQAFVRTPDRYEPHRRTIYADAWWHWGLIALLHRNPSQARQCFLRSLRQRFSLRVLALFASTLLPASFIQNIRTKWRQNFRSDSIEQTRRPAEAIRRADSPACPPGNAFPPHTPECALHPVPESGTASPPATATAPAPDRNEDRTHDNG
ncbi:MAG TPA: glycosyltransferase family 2 protein [Candidatus Sumerlaeota bacterium]|nr:glycosyltransferase family 2 protein [Candidatus Sumerlaeota bacterium]HPS01192.1 glycosyltransferase family 2 protein [Candidatus Sumerlaeota bacterium]